MELMRDRGGDARERPTAVRVQLIFRCILPSPALHGIRLRMLALDLRDCTQAQHVCDCTQQACSCTRPFILHLLHLCCVCRCAFQGLPITFPRNAALRGADVTGEHFALHARMPCPFEPVHSRTPVQPAYICFVCAPCPPSPLADSRCSRCVRVSSAGVRCAASARASRWFRIGGCRQSGLGLAGQLDFVRNACCCWCEPSFSPCCRLCRASCVADSCLCVLSMFF